jgi:hypothetical protein
VDLGLTALPLADRELSGSLGKCAGMPRVFPWVQHGWYYGQVYDSIQQHRRAQHAKVLRSDCRSGYTKWTFYAGF